MKLSEKEYKKLKNHKKIKGNVGAIALYMKENETVRMDEQREFRGEMVDWLTETRAKINGLLEDDVTCNYLGIDRDMLKKKLTYTDKIIDSFNGKRFSPYEPLVHLMLPIVLEMKNKEYGQGLIIDFIYRLLSENKFREFDYDSKNESLVDRIRNSIYKPIMESIL